MTEKSRPAAKAQTQKKRAAKRKRAPKGTPLHYLAELKAQNLRPEDIGVLLQREDELAVEEWPIVKELLAKGYVVVDERSSIYGTYSTAGEIISMALQGVDEEGNEDSQAFGRGYPWSHAWRGEMTRALRVLMAAGYGPSAPAPSKKRGRLKSGDKLKSGDGSPNSESDLDEWEWVDQIPAPNTPREIDSDFGYARSIMRAMRRMVRKDADEADRHQASFQLGAWSAEWRLKRRVDIFLKDKLGISVTNSENATPDPELKDEYGDVIQSWHEPCVAYAQEQNALHPKYKPAVIARMFTEDWEEKHGTRKKGDPLFVPDADRVLRFLSPRMALWRKLK